MAQRESSGDAWGTLLGAGLIVLAAFVYWGIWAMIPGYAWAVYAPWVSPLVVLITAVATKEGVRPFVRRVLAPHQPSRSLGGGASLARSGTPPEGLLQWMDRRREGLRNLCVGTMVVSGLVTLLGTGGIYGFLPIAARATWMWIIYLFEWFGLMVIPLVYFLMVDNEVIVERRRPG